MVDPKALASGRADRDVRVAGRTDVEMWAAVVMEIPAEEHAEQQLVIRHMPCRRRSASALAEGVRPTPAQCR